MKNKNIIFVSFLILIFSSFFQINADQIINFDVTEIEIKEKGNLLIGKNRGNISINDDSNIESNAFIYDKSKNIITFSGDVISVDKKNDIKIYSNLVLFDNNIKIISSYGKTKVLISSKYTLNTEDLVFDKNNMSITSKKKTSIIDNFNNYYSFEKFVYSINDEILKASNITLKNNINDEINSDNFFFKNGFFDLKNQNFKTDSTKIKFSKNIFGNKDNDPRLYAVSAYKKDNITNLNKAVFTSCKKNDDCPPWSLSANKITHDRNKKRLIYDDAVLQIYNFPVMYFPKFFHPDPSVERQSGFLTPSFNKSNITGTSFGLPYYLVLSENKDVTISPTIFNNNTVLIQNEYRIKGEKSLFTGDLGYVNDYKSSSDNRQTKNINHFFAKYTLDLKFPNFIRSNFSTKLERTNNDTYLKIFESNLINKKNLPSDENILSSEMKLELENNDYSFQTGISIYENLQMNKTDRFQYILPYYNFTKNYYENVPLGYINFESKGDNNLSNTNVLKSKILNSINYKTYNFYSQNGFVNNFGLYFKNLNTMGKNDEIYKSSVQSKIMGLAEFNSDLPMSKIEETSINTFTPKISLKLNPSDMQNYSTTTAKINNSTLYDVNRLGIYDNFESGNSLTYGFEFKKEDADNLNRYFSLNLGTVYRLTSEKDIPKSSTLDKKKSNYFGLIETKWDDILEFNYDFSIDSKLKNIEYNSVNVDINKNNFFSSLNYIKEKGIIGNENVIEGTIGYNIDKNNNLKFGTRRNKKIGLTEYYDLIYEYRNDCLTAGIKYKKLFYSDRDVKPSENLMFSVTIFPITSINQNFLSK